MERVWSLTIWRHEQPETSAYARMLRGTRVFVARERLPTHVTKGSWKPKANPRDNLGLFDCDTFFTVLVHEEARPRLEAMIASFGRAAAIHLELNVRPEAADFASADYLTLWGTSLPMRAVASEAEAFEEGPRCRCGAMDMRQIADLKVEGRRYLPWDVVNVNHASGGIIVSRRVAAMMKARAFTGYETRRVLDAATRRSLPLLQLVATSSVLASCARHDRTGVTFCKGCGRGLHGGEPEDGMTVRSPANGVADVVARHPHRHALLYVSQRLRKALVEMRAKGLRPPTDFLLVCTHPRRQSAARKG